MEKQQETSCCGWIPAIVILLVLGYLFLLTSNPGLRIKGKAKEAEVKQNLHAIQLALERYAVDHDGNYPMFMMGGDWTDSYVVTQGWCDTSGLFDQEVELAPPGMGDALVMEAYLPTFPENPFRKLGKSKLPSLLEHCNHLGEITTRRVSGRDGIAMVEIFGPQYVEVAPAGKNQQVNGDFFVHHIFNNPPYDLHDIRKEQGVDWNVPSGNEILVGNFSYYPHPSDDIVSLMGKTHISCIFHTAAMDKELVSGYTLAGYGSIRTSGMDVYNRNGNYKGRYRTEPCTYDCARYGLGYSLQISDIPCICLPQDAGIEPNPNQNNGGSDTLPDGVVITLNSGPPNPGPKVKFDESKGS